MPKQYPPLTPKQVIEILISRGFTRIRHGNHEDYVGIIKGISRIVPVKTNVDTFDAFLIKSMISQSGLIREEFYGSTKTTAVKIGIKHLPH